MITCYNFMFKTFILCNRTQAFFKHNSEAIGSRITLASPDPSATDSTNEINSEFTVYNNSHSVTFTPSITSKSHKKAQLVKGTVESVHFHRDLNDEL